jgi:hypothetical protein
MSKRIQNADPGGERRAIKPALNITIGISLLASGLFGGYSIYPVYHPIPQRPVAVAVNRDLQGKRQADTPRTIKAAVSDGAAAAARNVFDHFASHRSKAAKATETKTPEIVQPQQVPGDSSLGHKVKHFFGHVIPHRSAPDSAQSQQAFASSSQR